MLCIVSMQIVLHLPRDLSLRGVNLRVSKLSYQAGRLGFGLGGTQAQRMEKDNKALAHKTNQMLRW